MKPTISDAAKSTRATAGSPSSAKRQPAPHATSPVTPTVLLIGPWHQAEFAAIRAEIDAHNQWPTAPSLAAAVEHLAAVEHITNELSPPELILLAQPRPGVDRQEDIERLRRLAPLTRIIVIAGTWCEGELRTGHPLTGVVRLYWYEFPAWWRANVRAWANNRSPSWAEPLTEIRPGQFLRFDARGDSPDHPPTGALVIDATDYSVYEVLKAGLATYDWTCIWQPRHRPCLNRGLTDPPTAAIWDGAQLDDAELESLAALCTRLSAHIVPVVALIDFARVEHLNIAKAAGAAAVMAKPYQLALLNYELSRLTNAAAVLGGQ